MKKYFIVLCVLMVFAGFTSLMVSCGSSNSPTSSAATPTSTPSAPSESVSFSTGSFAPYSIRTAPNGNLWLLQYSPGKLEQVTTAGTLVGSVITNANGTAFDNPEGLAVDSNTGEVYVADYQNKQLESFSSSGAWLVTFASSLYFAEGVAINAAGTTVYAENDGTMTYQAYSVAQGAPPTYTRQSAGDIGAGTPGGVALNYPAGGTFDSNGNIWIADGSNNHRVVEFSSAGVYQKAITLQNSGTPIDVAVDNSGNVFAVDNHNNVVQEFNAAGQFLYNVTGNVLIPTGVTLDSTGNYIYVADQGRTQVAEFKIH